jgi:hypothetical protein
MQTCSCKDWDAPNAAHTVEASLDLSANSFIAFPNAVVATGTGSLQLNDTPPSPTKRFYRFRFP